MCYSFYNVSVCKAFDRFESKILGDTMPCPVHDLKVKVTDFLCKKFVLKFFFYNVSFCKAFFDGFDSCLAWW